SSAVFTGLAAGTYSLNVKGSTGCVNTASVTVSPFGNSTDDQSAAATDSWIGHVYTGTNFASYIGHYTEAESFNQSFGGSTTCFNITSGATSPSIYTEQFSVKYRMNSSRKGLYVADLGSDDGGRLTVDGTMVYNNWTDQAFALKPAVLFKLTGTSSLLYEFYENSGGNQVAFQNLTLILANTLSTNTSQNICIGSNGLAISGDTYGTLPSGITLSGTGYQWAYSTTAGGTRINMPGATGATYTPTGNGAPFNVSGTYYLYRTATVTSTNNLNPNPYTASLESNAAVVYVSGVNISQIPSSNVIANYKFEGNANDAANNNAGTLQGVPTPSVDRFGVANTAYSFNGSSQYVTTANPYSNPNNFTVSIWFRTTTNTGGKLIGFGSSQSAASGQYDRHIYMNNAGQIYFGVYPSTVVTVNSALSYNDDKWHLATATLSGAGMVLYVDGAQVGSNNATTTGENYTGYWRIAFDNCNGWTSQPTSNYFNGKLDDALIYSRALTPAEVATIFNSPAGAGNNGPVCSGSSLML
ncbi:MAG: LamG domain-containing protein, partial [Ferruginibacter sp.]